MKEFNPVDIWCFVLFLMQHASNIYVYQINFYVPIDVIDATKNKNNTILSMNLHVKVTFLFI